MVDHLSPEKRSECMSKIGGKNTSPEMKVRRLLFSLGYRYRLHRRDLPGKPDIVFPSARKIIFVNGCFWHGHKCKRLPKSNVKYWREKLEDNTTRDKKNIRKLRRLGWRVLVIWECWLKRPDFLQRKIVRFLN